MHDAGVVMPTWLTMMAEQAETALAEAPVVFEGVLAAAETVPLARELLFAASVYRLPFDALGLLWQAGEERPQPGRDAVMDARLEQLAGQLGQADAAPAGGIDEQEMLRLVSYQTSLMAPPIEVPDGAKAAREQLVALGLLEQVEREGAPPLLAVHPMTRDEIAAQADPAEVVAAHARAARYWLWRCGRLPRPPQDDIEELLEARYHLLVADRPDEAREVSSRLADVLGALGELATREGSPREGLGMTLRALGARLESGSGELARDMGQLLLQREALGDGFDEALAGELESPDSIAAVLELMRQAEAG
jgi:hypothetical protein